MSSPTSTRFALIGAGGYVAPRHMKAIRATGGDLVVAYDPNDSVGVLDSHFPDAHFFVEFERFDRHLDKIRRRGEGVERIAICSPNYLHDAHVRFALRTGADAICEKPLVLNPWNIDGLAEIARETGRRVDTILQLRLHPAVRALRERVAASDRVHDLDLTYVTSRGRWYHASWKGDEAKSGGIATNIGVHFFDMLHFVFGPVEESDLHLREDQRMAGSLRLRKANVRWFLSIDRADLPADTPALNVTAASLEHRRRADEAEDAYAARMAAARARPIALPYPAPNCNGGGAFVSAYAAAAGGAEPPFPTSRRIRSEAPRAADAPADAPAVYVEQPLFTDTLDYIFARQPQPLPAVAAAAAAAAALPGPPRAELQLVAVGALPTDASREGAMPSKDQPSDHAPLTATYRVVIAST